MTTYLLDANVLIALLVADHEFHDLANRWFATTGSVAVCPIVEGALVRTIVRAGARASTAIDALVALHAHATVQFWPDDVPYAEVGLRAVRGHKQVTDTYLVALARRHGGTLATFDRSLAADHDGAELITDAPSS